MATARELLCRNLGLPPGAPAQIVARSVAMKDPSPDSKYRRFVAKNFPDVGAALGGPIRVGPVVVASRPPSVDAEAETRAFTQQWFPEITAAAAGRYALPGGLPDPTPLSNAPSGTPATAPPTGQVRRSPQLPPSTAPPAYKGPAVAPAAPVTTVTPMGPPPAALTPQQIHDRRCGFPITAERTTFDITQRQGPGQIDYTRA